ncbi:MAG: hypothetical protein ACI4EH_02665 [Oliverpabstia sp.]
MAKNYIWKTLAGVAVAGAAVGGALAYLKKCKDVNDLSEEDFEDLLNDEDEDACPAERTYTTLPTEHAEEEKAEEAAEETEDSEETEAAEEPDTTEEETAEEPSAEADEVTE